MNKCSECSHKHSNRNMCTIRSKTAYDFMLDDYVLVRLVPCFIMKRLPFCKFERRQFI